MVQEIEKLAQVPQFIRNLRQKSIETVARQLRSEKLLDPGVRFLLEIGSGHGDWLTAYAQGHPESVCVGLELLGMRYRKCVRKALDAGLSNVHYFKTEATEFLEALESLQPISDTVILFPDPWPKGRHWGRRLIQPTFLRLLAEHSQPGARLFFRSDDTSYALWTRKRIAESPFWELEEAPEWLFEQPTVFQNYARSYTSVIARLKPAGAHQPASEPSFE